jgi:hypothetical protein
MVWDLLGMLLVLVGSIIISLDYYMELYILVYNGQNWTDIGSVNIGIQLNPLVVTRWGTI